MEKWQDGTHYGILKELSKELSWRLNKMKKTIIVIGILVLIGIIGFYSTRNSEPTEYTIGINRDQSNQQKSGEQYIIKITPNGFNPSVLTINAGERVIWVNKYNLPSWPASNVHPTHTLYPGSNINKCGTSELIFDACKNLKQGESFSFTLNEKGSWRYHDHLDPGTGGTINVK